MATSDGLADDDDDDELLIYINLRGVINHIAILRGLPSMSWSSLLLHRIALTFWASGGLRVPAGGGCSHLEIVSTRCIPPGSTDN